MKLHITIPADYWTDEDNRELDRLRRLTGKDWDAINHGRGRLSSTDKQLLASGLVTLEHTSVYIR